MGVNACLLRTWRQHIPERSFTDKFLFIVRAPHAGTANVSIVETATNSIIGTPLITYSDFGNNAYAIPANQTSFSITIPDLGSKCAVAGACVVQHYWDARSIDQTYESCVDFTVGGSGAAAPAPVASSSAAVPAATSAAPVASSVASAPVATAAPVESSAIPSSVPTTLQTLVRSSSTEAAAPVATSAPTEEYDDCE